MSIETFDLAVGARAEHDFDPRSPGGAPRARRPSAARAPAGRAEGEARGPEAAAAPRGAPRGRPARAGLAPRGRPGPAVGAPSAARDVRAAAFEVAEQRGRDEANALLGYLATKRDFDFASYQEASLLRRIGCRIAATGTGGFRAYRDYLERRPEEYLQLLETVPVQRTEFFRNDEAWAHLAAEVLPRVLRGKAPGEPVRVWSAGCATGQEAYTLAIALAEAAGPGGAAGRAVVYATDVSDGAVAQATAGRYRAERLRQVRPEVLAKYFVRDGDDFVIRPELRRLVAFGRHDLLRDPPLPRMDLVACRNTLMYFTTAAQARVLANFYRALVGGGLLFTGQVETPQIWSDLFAPESPEHHLYRKAESRGRGAALALLASAPVDATRPPLAARQAEAVGRGCPAFAPDAPPGRAAV